MVAFETIHTLCINQVCVLILAISSSITKFPNSRPRLRYYSFLQISPRLSLILGSFTQLVHHPSTAFRMAEIACIMGEKKICRMEVDYSLLDVNIFCIEEEPVIEALSSIPSMVSRICNSLQIQYIGRCLSKLQLNKYTD